MSRWVGSDGMGIGQWCERCFGGYCSERVSYHVRLTTRHLVAKNYRALDVEEMNQGGLVLSALAVGTSHERIRGNMRVIRAASMFVTRQQQRLLEYKNMTGEGPLCRNMACAEDQDRGIDPYQDTH